MCERVNANNDYSGAERRTTHAKVVTMSKQVTSIESELPKQTSTYTGPLTDTSRWGSFRSRVDDILICTPPKCGTTWTQAICALLVFETSEFKGKLTGISPWFDSKLESLDVCVATLESQDHRRFVKTHTPLDGVPYFPNCKYLIVYRDPKDVFFSSRNHLLNMIAPPDIPQLASDPNTPTIALNLSAHR